MSGLPGIPGFIAFAGVKFGGYYLAGFALRKWQPAVTGSALRIAATRTGLGVLIGPPLTIGLAYVMAKFFPQFNTDLLFLSCMYTFIFVLRVLVWALVIYLFTKQMNLLRSKFWSYAALGAVWSCLLDLPGIWLAIISPGQVPFC